MKFRIFGVAAFSLLSVQLFAQNETDVLRYSQTFMKGSARFTSMGGAFGALGGDISSMMVNPAGIGVYRTGEFVFSTGINNTNLHTDYQGSSAFDNLTRMSIGNTGIVMPVYSSSTTPLKNFNIGVSYNRVNEFHMNSTLSAFNNTNSMLDFFGEWSYGLSENSLNNNGKFLDLGVNDWRSKLAYMNGLISPDSSNPGAYFTALNKDDKVFQDQWTTVRGFNDVVNLSFGGNIMDVVYFGGAFNVTNIKFSSVNTVSETAEKNNTSNFDYFNYDQIYNAYATGYSLSLGVILKPIQEFRVGLSYQSPTWTFVDDDYSAYMNSNYNKSGLETPISTYSYRVYSPQRLTGSLAAVIGNFAILSADVDWVNYSNMKLKLKGRESGNSYEQGVNGAIKSDFRNTVNLRAGLEFKLDNNFSLRGGYQYYQNPYKDGIVTDHPVNFYAIGTGYNDAAGSGINKPVNVYSAGFGYRTRSFFVDFAYSLMTTESSYSLYDKFDPNNSIDVYSGTATQRINKNSYILTLGFKF